MYIAPIIQGDAKAPSQMKEGSVYNLIDKLDPTDLKYLLLLLLLGVDVYHLGMSLSRPLAAPSKTVLSLAMSLATTRHAAT